MTTIILSILLAITTVSTAVLFALMLKAGRRIHLDIVEMINVVVHEF